MSKYLKSVCFYIVLAIFCISLGGCSSGEKNNEEEDIPLETVDLDPVIISFCFIGYGPDSRPRNLGSINEMLEELNKKTSEALHTTVKFQWLPYENYDVELIKLLQSAGGPDAFFTYNPEEQHKAGVVKDITDLLPQTAPQYFSLLSETWREDIRYAEVDHKLYGILNNGIYPPQYFIIARQDLVEKYAPEGIDSLEDYGRFMQAVKDKEKDMVPGYASANNFFEAYMLGNGYFQGSGTGLYCRWNSEKLTQIPIETTEEFKSAYKLYRQWREGNLLLDPESREYGTLVRNGQLVSMIISGMDMHSPQYLDSSYKYGAYPLYMDSMYTNTLLTYSIGINANSPNGERVLRFIEWLHSRQENYDLFHYGIKDKHYKLLDNALDISQSGNNAIVDWWGSMAFRNYRYDRPYPFEPVNYKEFLNNCLINTFSYREAYEKFGYDIDKHEDLSAEEKKLYAEEYEKTKEFSKKRSNIYFEFITQTNAGNFTKTLSEMMEEQGGKSSTDRLLEYYKTGMEKYKK